MSRARLVLFLTLLLAVALFLSCGVSSPHRVLQTISISPAVGTAPMGIEQEVQFVATGTFSAPPVTVTPLPTVWVGNLPELPNHCYSDGCAGLNPNGLAICSGAFTATITASAPQDPNLPLGTDHVPMISARATLICN